MWGAVPAAGKEQIRHEFLPYSLTFSLAAAATACVHLDVCLYHGMCTDSGTGWASGVECGGPVGPAGPVGWGVRWLGGVGVAGPPYYYYRPYIGLLLA